MEKISVIIPVKEPEPYLGTLISQIHKSLQQYSHEILIQSEPGLGNAIYHGVERAKGDTIVIMDADGSHIPAELPTMLQQLKDYDIVIGSKNIQGGLNADSFFRRRISKIYNKLTSFLLRIKLTDPMSGYIVAKKKVFKDYIFPSGYKFMLPLYIYKNYKVKEHPITFTIRKEGKSKTSAITGLRTLGFILKLFFNKNKIEINKFLSLPILCFASYLIMYLNVTIFVYLFKFTPMNILITNPVLGWMAAIMMALFIAGKNELKDLKYKNCRVLV
jgi:glycosyltransferase involved in cell wall biosynthesis